MAPHWFTESCVSIYRWLFKESLFAEQEIKGLKKLLYTIDDIDEIRRQHLAGKEAQHAEETNAAAANGLNASPEQTEITGDAVEGSSGAKDEL